jgi:hypothetical protein
MSIVSHVNETKDLRNYMLVPALYCGIAAGGCNQEGKPSKKTETSTKMRAAESLSQPHQITATKTPVRRSICPQLCQM